MKINITGKKFARKRESYHCNHNITSFIAKTLLHRVDAARATQAANESLGILEKTAGSISSTLTATRKRATVH